MFQPDMFPAEVTHVTLDTGVNDTITALHAQSRLINTLQQLAALQQQTIQRLESELAEVKCTML